MSQNSYLIDYLNKQKEDEEKLRSGVRPEVQELLASKFDLGSLSRPIEPSSNFDVGVSASTATAPVQLPEPSKNSFDFKLDSPFAGGSAQDVGFRDQFNLQPANREVNPVPPQPMAPKPAPVAPKPEYQAPQRPQQPGIGGDPSQEGMSPQQIALDNAATKLNEDIARADKASVPQLIAAAFAGLGDAMVARGGGSSDFLGKAMGARSEQRKGLERRRELLTGRQDVEAAAAEGRRSAAGTEKQRRFEADRTYGLELAKYGTAKTKAEAEAAAKGKEGKGLEQVDKEFATLYAEYQKGGFADEMKQIDQLRNVKTALESGGNYSGPLLGRVSRENRSLINPKSVNVQEQVEEVVQRNLRAILGAQFAKEEGERLIDRAYNPLMDEATNADRVNRLLVQMEAASIAKREALDYYVNNGYSMEGFEGMAPEQAFWQAGGGRDEDENVPRGTNEGSVMSKTTPAEDSEALEWAKNNPGDPRSARILMAQRR